MFIVIPPWNPIISLLYPIKFLVSPLKSSCLDGFAPLYSSWSPVFTSSIPFNPLYTRCSLLNPIKAPFLDGRTTIFSSESVPNLMRRPSFPRSKRLSVPSFAPVPCEKRIRPGGVGRAVHGGRRKRWHGMDYLLILIIIVSNYWLSIDYLLIIIDWLSIDISI